jgi:hypothetical protein
MDNTELGSNREKLDAVAEQQDVAKKGATVETTGALEGLYGGRHLAVGHSRKPKKRTQGVGRSSRRMTYVQERHSFRDAIIKDRRSRRDHGSGRNSRME